MVDVPGYDNEGQVDDKVADPLKTYNFTIGRGRLYFDTFYVPETSNIRIKPLPDGNAILTFETAALTQGNLKLWASGQRSGILKYVEDNPTGRNKTYDFMGALSPGEFEIQTRNPQGEERWQHLHFRFVFKFEHLAKAFFGE